MLTALESLEKLPSQTHPLGSCVLLSGFLHALLLLFDLLLFPLPLIFAPVLNDSIGLATKDGKNGKWIDLSFEIRCL